MTQNILVYGQYDGEIRIASGGVLFFALCCDFKEIYQTLRSIVPLFPKTIPMVTLDTTYEKNSLYIGNKTISLMDITEANTFSEYFIYSTILGYLLGCFPWCIASMIIRNQYLSFGVMRVVTPAIGTTLMLRAILGPGIFIKGAFAFHVLFNMSLRGREDLGLAFKTSRTFSSAINMSFFLACGGALLLSVVQLRIATLAFGVFLLLGFFYGGVTGCSHSLPIRPWMLLTTASEGVWLRVKEKRRCPCVYWCGYCSDMHDSCEVFVIFPRDQVTFLHKLKGSVESQA
jgi:hypothetical protein